MTKSFTRTLNGSMFFSNLIIESPCTILPLFRNRCIWGVGGGGVTRIMFMQLPFLLILGSIKFPGVSEVWLSFRPSTLTSYKRMFALFLSFLVALGLSLPQMSTLDVLAFMEYVLQSGMSASNIINHLTAIRSMCIIYNCDSTPFRDNRIPLFVKAMKLNRPLQPKLHFVIEALLEAIILACSLLHSPLVFKALYLLAFYSFLKLSNMLPHSVASFDNTRHLCVGDVISQYAVIIIKLSKTIQDRSRVACISIPALDSATICPVSALTRMLHIQTSPDDPFFQVTTRRGSTPLTDSVTRKHLKQVSIMLNTPKILTFHDFRRAGATWALRHGVPVQEIQAQGTWSCACVWQYIQVPPSQWFFCGSLYFSVIPICLMLHTSTPTWHLGLFLPLSDISSL